MKQVLSSSATLSHLKHFGIPGHDQSSCASVVTVLHVTIEILARASPARFVAAACTISVNATSSVFDVHDFPTSGKAAEVSQYHSRWVSFLVPMSLAYSYHLLSATHTPATPFESLQSATVPPV